MMLAGRYTDQPVRGWWLSEKLEGVRAFWDGDALRTRTWRAIAAPEWFTASLPQGTALDGELWGGLGTFQTASELARFERASDPAWRQMRFMVFDAPTTDAVPVEQRIAKVAELVRGEYAQAVTHRACLGRADVETTLAETVRAGGEGLVLRRPGSCYVFGRSCDQLKVKPQGVD